MARKPRKPKAVETLVHDEASRRNIPTAESDPIIADEDKTPVQVAYERRNLDLDPQLVWRGKDAQDGSDLVVQAPSLYIQEKVHPKVLIDDLLRQSKARAGESMPETLDLFADFNGLPSEGAKTEFYQHDANWSNRMILGDSLQVMTSLAEREGLRGKVQCIYIDPPYGIKFNSNFQWSTTSRDVRDGNAKHITREPEQVKAFRDTWRDGIHSYLTYLRDRLTVARDLLTDSGSVFVQIGDENVHRVRSLADEVFGEDNFINLITCRVSSGTTRKRSLRRVSDYLLWYGKDAANIKFRRLLKRRPVETSMYNQIECDLHRRPMTPEERRDASLIPGDARAFRKLPLHSMSAGDHEPRECFGKSWPIPNNRSWRYAPDGFQRLLMANRVHPDKKSLCSVYYHDDYPASEHSDCWSDTGPEIDKSYVVQTSTNIIQRCLLMTTAPGDLVLDPTCGSGTTAYVAEQWGRRWITIDTSRVALALVRARIMGARYPWYLLSDSLQGQGKEAEIKRTIPLKMPTYGDIRHGFVYERVPHITLKSIARNAEIDVIWGKYQETLEPIREKLNKALGKTWEEWEIPHEATDGWSAEAKNAHRDWWAARLARQRKIDASITARADVEHLYDQPYDDKARIRVAGPFTVESVAPHRVLGVDEDDELVDGMTDANLGYDRIPDFASMILQQLEMAGVQQAHKEDRIDFSSLAPWPGGYVCAEGRYVEGSGESGVERRAAIFIGPEFGTVSRPDLIAATREAANAGFDVLIACAFSYDAHSADFQKLGRIPVLKARMNTDLHMASDLKNTGKGNLFVIFGEPDIDILDAGDGRIQVKINGVDVFDPNAGKVRSDGPDGIACWFIDTDYNEESFFVRHAYFLGTNDPYKKLRNTLKAEIDPDAWATLNRDISRPFGRPASGRIAVKVINHLGDEVMKVLRA